MHRLNPFPIWALVSSLLFQVGLYADVKLAILNAHEAADYVALLESELSGINEIELLERENLPSIIDEFRLQSANYRSGDPINLNRFFGTDGLVFVGRDSTRSSPHIRIRVVAVQSGLVIFSASLPSESFAEKETIKKLASQFYGLEAAFVTPRDQIYGVSSAGVNGSTNAARKVEDLFNQLLVDAMGSLPGVSILDRRNLSDLEWEKMFMEAGEPFWRSSLVVRGALHAQEEGFTAEMDLAFPSHPETKRLTVRGTNLFAMTYSLSKDIEKAIASGRGSEGVHSDRESHFFDARAAEKNRVRNKEEALRAAETAIALGSRNLNTISIRSFALLSRAQLTEGGLFSAMGVENLHFWLSKLDERSALISTHALALFNRDAPPPADPKLFSEWEQKSTGLITTSSAILRSFYYQKQGMSESTHQALYGLRSEVRMLVDRHLAGVEKMRASGKRYWFGSDIFEVIGIYNGFWHDDPDEWRRGIESYLSHIRERKKEDPLSDHFVNVLVNRSSYNPLYVVWDPTVDQSFEKAYHDFLLNLSGSDTFFDKVTALQFKLCLLPDIYGAYKYNRVPTIGYGITPEHQKRHKAINALTFQRYERLNFQLISDLTAVYCDVVWAARDQLASQEGGWLDLRRHYTFIEGILDVLEGQTGSDVVNAHYHRLRRKKFAYFVEKGSDVKEMYFDLHPPAYYAEPWSETESILKKAAEIQPGLQTNLSEAAAGILTVLPPDLVESATKKGSFSYPMRKADRFKFDHRNLTSVHQTNGTIFLLQKSIRSDGSSVLYYANVLDSKLRSREKEQKLTWKNPPLPEWVEQADGKLSMTMPTNAYSSGVPATYLSDRMYLLSTSEGLKEYTVPATHTASYPIPLTHNAHLQELDGKLYVFQSEPVVGLAVFDPETKAFEVLPRFPGRHGYKGIRCVYSGINGQLHAILDRGHVLRYEQENQQWVRLIDGNQNNRLQFTELLGIISSPYLRYGDKRKLFPSLKEDFLQSEEYKTLIPSDEHLSDPFQLLDVRFEANMLCILFNRGGLGLQIFDKDTRSFKGVTLDFSGEAQQADPKGLEIALVTKHRILLVSGDSEHVYSVNIEPEKTDTL